MIIYYCLIPHNIHAEFQTISSRSPIWIRALSMAPSGSSRTPSACRHETTGRKGRRPFTILVTMKSLSRKTTSIGNLIQKVWMALQRAIHRPSSFFRRSRPISPTNLETNPTASFTSAATTLVVEVFIAFTAYPFFAAIFKIRRAI